MRILLLGKDGQVGWELQRALAPLGAIAGTGPYRPARAVWRFEPARICGCDRPGGRA